MNAPIESFSQHKRARGWFGTMKIVREMYWIQTSASNSTVNCYSVFWVSILGCKQRSGRIGLFLGLELYLMVTQFPQIWWPKGIRQTGLIWSTCLPDSIVETFADVSYYTSFTYFQIGHSTTELWTVFDSKFKFKFLNFIKLETFW